MYYIHYIDSSNMHDVRFLCTEEWHWVWDEKPPEGLTLPEGAWYTAPTKDTEGFCHTFSEELVTCPECKKKLEKSI